MATITIYDKTGKKSSKTMDLNQELYGLEVNEHLLYLAQVRQEANARAGSAHSKTRAEVRGGGAKPWKQKGTGRARAGTNSSPLWKGGGVTHGPRNYTNWTKGMNTKESLRALFSAILLAQKENRFAVIEELSVKASKTKEFTEIIKNAELCSQKVLFVVDSTSTDLAVLEQVSGNVANKKVIAVSGLNVRDLLKADMVIPTTKALEEMNTRFTPVLESAKFQAELAQAVAA